MGTLSKIKHLYAYEDGDTITPRMGVQIDAGFGLQQYYDPNTDKVTQTDFTKHPAKLFPQAWSSKLAKVIVPASTGQQWYYNNIADNAGILDETGAVKAAYQNIFAVDSVVMNDQTYPALRIIGNLVDEKIKDFTDKYIYYVGTYNGKQFTCQQLIPVQAAVGDAYSILISVMGADGSGDDTLSADNDWVEYTAYLQLAGVTVNDAVFTFEHLESGVWKKVTTNAGVVEVAKNTLKLYDAAIEGTEMYRCVATYNSKTYYKTMEPSDIHDPRYIEDGCNIAGDSVKSGEKVTFNPKVYLRETGEDVTSKEGWTFGYTLIKRQDATVITDMTIDGLDYESISSKGGISVRIEATAQL